MLHHSPTDTEYIDNEETPEFVLPFVIENCVSQKCVPASPAPLLSFSTPPPFRLPPVAVGGMSRSAMTTPHSPWRSGPGDSKFGKSSLRDARARALAPSPIVEVSQTPNPFQIRLRESFELVEKSLAEAAAELKPSLRNKMFDQSAFWKIDRPLPSNYKRRLTPRSRLCERIIERIADKEIKEQRRASVVASAMENQQLQRGSLSPSASRASSLVGEDLEGVGGFNNNNTNSSHVNNVVSPRGSGMFGASHEPRRGSVHPSSSKHSVTSLGAVPNLVGASYFPKSMGSRKMLPPRVVDSIRNIMGGVRTEAEKSLLFDKELTEVAKTYITLTRDRARREKEILFHQNQHRKWMEVNSSGGAHHGENSASAMPRKLTHNIYDTVRRTMHTYSPNGMLYLADMPEGGWVVANLLLSDAVFSRIDVNKTGRVTLMDLLTYMFPHVSKGEMGRLVATYNRNDAQRKHKDALFGVKNKGGPSSGTIPGLTELVAKYSIPIINEACEIFALVDHDTKGYLTEGEFVTWRRQCLIHQEEQAQALHVRGQETEGISRTFWSSATNARGGRTLEEELRSEFVSISRCSPLGPREITLIEFLDFVHTYCVAGT